MPQHLISLENWTAEDMQTVIELARKVKTSPDDYRDALKHKNLVMLFEKPSLRTRLSFEIGMNQLGGNAVYYDLSTSPMGAGKESIPDTVEVLCRYADIMMARLFDHEHMVEMGETSSIPLINGLTNYNHPGQILADLQTIAENKETLKGLTLSYFGDANNNVTHSLLFGCSKMGMNIRVACPQGAESEPQPDVLAKAKEFAAASGSTVEVLYDAKTAADGCDVLYADSWMSYHIPKDQLEARVERFMPYQINAGLMAIANPNAIFMNCLPAIRGYEQTAEVIDGPQSVAFDEAENRMHTHKALMLHLLAQC